MKPTRLHVNFTNDNGNRHITASIAIIHSHADSVLSIRLYHGSIELVFEGITLANQVAEQLSAYGQVTLEKRFYD